MTYLLYLMLSSFLCALPTDSDFLDPFLEHDHVTPSRVPLDFSPVAKVQNLEQSVLASRKRIEAQEEIKRLLEEFSPHSPSSIIGSKNPTRLAKAAVDPLLEPSLRPSQDISRPHQGKVFSQDIFRPRQGNAFNDFPELIPFNHKVPPKNTIAKKDWEHVLRLLEKDDTQPDTAVKKAVQDGHLDDWVWIQKARALSLDDHLPDSVSSFGALQKLKVEHSSLSASKALSRASRARDVFSKVPRFF